MTLIKPSDAMFNLTGIVEDRDVFKQHFGKTQIQKVRHPKKENCLDSSKSPGHFKKWGDSNSEEMRRQPTKCIFEFLFKKPTTS